MRYTRYNHKKKRDNTAIKFITSLVLTIVAAGVIGLGLARVIVKVIPTNNLGEIADENTEQTSGTNVSESQNQDQNQNNSTIEVSVNTSFVLLQCGYFSSKDNASQALTKVGDGYGSFIAEDGDKFRVVAGIYTADSVQAAVDNLKSKGVESIKVNIDLNSEDKVESQIAAISDGYLKILSEAFKDDVKFIETKDFKDWVNNLEEVKELEGSDILATLKTYVSQLPEQIKKEDVSKEMDYLYDTLIKFKQN